MDNHEPRPRRSLVLLLAFGLVLGVATVTTVATPASAIVVDVHCEPHGNPGYRCHAVVCTEDGGICLI